MKDINLCRKMAWSFHFSTGLEYQDLFSEACLAYLERPTKQPKTIPSIYIRNQLINYCKRIHYTKYRVQTSDDLLKYEGTIDNMNKTINLISGGIDAMSRDCNHIADIILNDSNIDNEWPPKKVRGYIFKVLRNNDKWKLDRIWDAFRNMPQEIEKVF